MYKNDILNELRYLGADIRTLTIIKKFFESNSKLAKQSLKDFCKNSNCFYLSNNNYYFEREIKTCVNNCK